MSVTLQEVKEEELRITGEDETELEPVVQGVKEVKKALFLGEGDCYEALVEKIELGRLMDFIPNPPQQYADTWEQRKHRLAYRFKVVIPEFDLEGYDIITISAKENSRMSQLRVCYGQIEVGGKVYVCVKNGRLKISCPPQKPPFEKK